MPLPIVFRGGGERAIASYDYVDVAEGTGIITFYGGGTRDSVGVKYRLDRHAFWCSTYSGSAEDNYYKASTGGGGYSKIIDIDFDTTEFNLPVTIGGTSLCNCPYSSRITNDWNDTSGNMYAVVDYKKVDAAAAETSLISTTSSTISIGWSGASPPAPTDAYFTMLSVIPLTHFKKGEKLRITVEIYMKDNGGSGDPTITLGFDPQSLAIPATPDTYAGITAGYSTMQFLIPFRIDL